MSTSAHSQAGACLRPDIFEWFARDPRDPGLLVVPAVFDQNHPIARELEDQLSRFDRAQIADTEQDPEWRRQYDDAKGPARERLLRAWTLKLTLDDAIASERYQHLTCIRDQRPAPYSHPALVDLELGSEGLVPLREFKVIGGTLFRNGMGFVVAPGTGSPNSSYWVTELLEANFRHQAKVRLDPLMYGPEGGFPVMFYKLFWYGRPIRWAQLASLKEEDHGRLVSGGGTPAEVTTEYVWKPKDREVSFECEEIPDSIAPKGGARYLHAIFDIGEAYIGHCDGALRFYQPEVLLRRRSEHLRKAGKVGNRVKLFRIDGPAQPDAFSALVSAFFVWNSDVKLYFAERSEPTEPGTT